MGAADYANLSYTFPEVLSNPLRAEDVYPIKKLGGQFLCSVVIVAAFAVIFLFFGILTNTVALLFIIWIVVFALVANEEKIMWKAKGHKDDKIRGAGRR